MRAITVQQPWAWAIIHGGKNVENRARGGAWCPAIGQRIAVHAGQRWSAFGGRDARVLLAAREWRPLSRGFYAPIDPAPAAGDGPLFAFGAIIGTVEVSGVHESTGRPGRDACCEPWGESYNGPICERMFHLVLHRPVAVEPIPCKGRLGLWTVPDDIASRLGTA